jgi:cyanate permease
MGVRQGAAIRLGITKGVVKTADSGEATGLSGIVQGLPYCIAAASMSGDLALVALGDTRFTPVT